MEVGLEVWVFVLMKVGWEMYNENVCIIDVSADVERRWLGEGEMRRLLE